MGRGRTRNRNQFNRRASGPGPGERGKNYDPVEKHGDRVKQVQVAYATSNSSVCLHAPVTMPRLPWEEKTAPAGGAQEHE